MSSPDPEFSQIVNVRDLPKDGAKYSISVNSEDCIKLATRFGLVQINKLNAKLRLDRQARSAVRLSGKIEAQITQTCVVTLEPVREDISVDIDIIFRPNFDEFTLDNSEFDSALDFEPLPGDTLDLGEIVSEELALSINPYPRVAGAPLIGPNSNDERSKKPFAALSAIKYKDANI